MSAPARSDANPGDQQPTGDAPVLVRDVDGIVTLTLNRPSVGNAINQPLADAFTAAVRAIDPNRTRAVVLAATGRMFCAGGDVGDMSRADDRAGFLDVLAGTVHDGLIALRALPVPIVTVVQGTVAGGGLGFVLAADIVLSATSAQFLTAYAGVGLTPDCGVSALLPAVVGARRAALLALTGRVLTADEAQDWGLVSEVVEPDQLTERVAAVIAALAAAPLGALGEAARLLRAAPDRGYAEGLADEAATIARMAAGEQAARLIAEFVARQSAPKNR
jgi:2-(1,2-epoxy-1,2-dihydrophenyl)acetyl-CoA isomerase